MVHKLLKKIAGIFGFKLIDKDLFKNNRLLSNNTIFSLKDFLTILFQNQKIHRLLQIGANDGERFDEINFFIKKYLVSCILVEPVKEYFDELKKNYKDQKNIIFENQCISVNNEITFLYKVKSSRINFYDEHIKGIASFDFNHLIKHGVKKSDITKEEVNSISISDLLKKHSVDELNLLIVDAESYDAQIIKDFLENLDIRSLIIFEYIHIKHKKFKEVIELLKKKDYVYFSLGENLVCIPNEKRPNFNLIFN